MGNASFKHTILLLLCGLAFLMCTARPPATSTVCAASEPRQPVKLMTQDGRRPDTARSTGNTSGNFHTTNMQLGFTTIHRNTRRLSATLPGVTPTPIAAANGTHSLLSSLSVTITSPPVLTITGFTPPAGPVGTVVIISGTGFDADSPLSINRVSINRAETVSEDDLQVFFNGVAAEFELVSDSQIIAVVPSGATTGPITVERDDETATSSTNFIVTTSPTPPIITNFTPPSGPVGTVVSIFGANFAGVTAVRFNGVNATFSVASTTQITATVPPEATTGPITVTTAGGTATSTAPFVVTQAPVILRFSPTSGPVGTVVEITGMNFVDVTNVAFNGISASFSVPPGQASRLTAVVPVGATTGRITVTTSGGTAVSEAVFVVTQPPTILSFTPASGTVGTPVAVTGTNFEGAINVTFGGVRASFSVISPTQITAIVPVGAVTGPIRVTTPNGTAISNTDFTVIARVPPQRIGVFRPNQAFLLRQSNTAGPPDIIVPLGQTGDLPVVGDWDGDRKTTVALFRNGQFLIRNENVPGAPVITVAFGAAGDIPLAGDWTGKGFDSLGVFRRGVFLLRNANTPGSPDIVVNYGLPTDLPVVGDWNGDGKTTIGAFRPSTGFFFLRNENTSGNADISFFYGLADDLPVAGDWDGDGVTTIGVFRAGTFFLRNTNTAGFADLAVAFGQVGDLPLAGRWKDAPIIPPGDFGTGNSTVVWRNQTTGQTAIWVMNGTTFLRSELLPFAEDCWFIGGTADFTGNGNTDLLWRNQTITGFDAVWAFSSVNPTASLPVTPEQTDLNWTLSGTGDFNRDGRPDIIRRNTATDAVEIWLMNGTARAQILPLTIPELLPTETIVGSGDVDGDGKPELFLHNQSTGSARIVTVIGATAVNSRPLPSPGSGWRLAAIGDYNRDGRPDLVWRNLTTGQNVIWLLRDLALVQSVTIPEVPDQRWQIVGPR